MDPFEILAREHADMLTVYLRCLLRDEAAVDDVFQETMIIAWRRLKEFDQSRPFGAWLRGIARRLVLAHRREAARNPVLCEDAVLERLSDSFAEIDRQPGDTFEERLAALHKCLAELAEPARDAIRFRYDEKLSCREIADRLTVTVEVIKKRLQRARTQLHVCIQRRLAKEGVE